MRSILWIVAVLSLLSSSAAATIFPVTNTNDSGSGSLREALQNAAASPGPHIIDALQISGFIGLTSPLPAVSENVTLAGPGANLLTVGRAPFTPTGTVADYLLRVNTGGTLTLKDIEFNDTSHLEWAVLLIQSGAQGELDNCKLERTGGVENQGTLTVRDCIFSNNSAPGYGAVLQKGNLSPAPALLCERSSFSSNSILSTAGYEAGAVCVTLGSSIFRECTFQFNNASSGPGAIYAKGAITVLDCVFEGNASSLGTFTGTGGACKIVGVNFDVFFERVLFKGNSAYAGGAVHLWAQSAGGLCLGHFHDCCFTANTASHDGGAVYADYSSQCVLYNCTLSGNAAGGKGGGIFALNTTTLLDHCTLTLNSAATQYGGCNSSTAFSSVIANNFAPAIPDSAFPINIVCACNFIGVTVSNVWGLTEVRGTSSVPLDPMLGPLQYNGGPTPTHMPLPGSPLIDAGARVTWPIVAANHNFWRQPNDQTGRSRAVDCVEIPNVSGGDGSDIGACEFRLPWQLSSVDPLLLTTTTLGTPSMGYPVQISAASLGATLDINAGAPFEVSLNASAGYGASIALAPAGGALPLTTFYVRYHPSGGFAHNGELRLSSSASLTQVLLLNGRLNQTSQPYLEFEGLPLLLNGTVGTSGFAKPVEVFGGQLSVPVTLNCSAGFEISPDPVEGWSTSFVVQPIAGGTLPRTTVYVRYRAIAAGSVNGALTATSGGAIQAMPLVGATGFLTNSVQVNRNAPLDNSGFHLTQMELPTSALGLPSVEQSYVISSTGTLSAPLIIETAAPFEISLNSGTGFTSSITVPGVSANGTIIYVRYLPRAGSSHGGQLVQSSGGIALDILRLLGWVTGPSQIVVSANSMCFNTSALSIPSAVQSYQLSGTNLTRPINVSTAGSIGLGAPFQVSLSPTTGFANTLTTAMPTSGVLNPVTIYVRFNPTSGSPGTLLCADVVNTDSIAEPRIFSVSGSIGSTPAVQASVLGQSHFGWSGGPSLEQSYFVYGHNLTAGITVTAPAAFEVSLTSGGGFGPSVITPAPVGGLVFPTAIFVRYNPGAVGSHTGSITNTSGSASSAVLEYGFTPGPNIQTSLSAMTFATGVGFTSTVQAYTVSGTNLNAPVNVSVAAPFEVSLSASSGFGGALVTGAPVQGVLAPTIIYVRYAPTAAGTHIVAVNNAVLSVPTALVTLTGNTIPPSISLSATALTFQTSAIGVPSTEQSYSVSGAYLSGPITVTATTDFEVSLTSGGPFGIQVSTGAPTGGVVPLTTIYVRYLPYAGVAHTGVCNHDSPGVSTVNLNLSGSLPPTISVSVATLYLETAQGVISPEKSYTVSGTNLTAPITLSVAAPFEMSFVSAGIFSQTLTTAAPVGGAVPATTVYIRYAPTIGLLDLATLGHSSPGAATVNIAVTGVGYPRSGSKSSDTSSSCMTEAGGSWLELALFGLALLALARRSLSRVR